MRMLAIALSLALGAVRAHAGDAAAPPVHVAIAASALAPDADTVRRVFVAELAASHRATAGEQYDVSIVAVHVERARGMVELSMTMHVVVSDRAGKLHAFGAGTAKVQVPRSRYRASALPALREQALAETASTVLGSLAAPRREPTS